MGVQVEYPGYTSSNHHYQNLPNPFTVPCGPPRVACNMSPKFVSKNSHRVAADVTSCDADDQPPPHSKQRLHHPQRVRKHSTNGTAAAGHKHHHSCHYVNCDHNRSQAEAAENTPMELSPSSAVSCAHSASHILPALGAEQATGNCATSTINCATNAVSCATSNSICATGAGTCATSNGFGANSCATATCTTVTCARTGESGASAAGWPTESGRAASLTSAAPLSLLIPPPASVYTLSKADQRLSESFYSSEDDLRIISESQQYLRLSGWYHARLSWPQASELLMHAPVGTFLLRNSSDVNHLYSLSVQTKCGPTSIRIHYAKGWFRLAGSGEEAKQLPRFPCIMQLIQHYADRTQKLPMPCTPDENRDWANVGGPPTTTPIVLRKPMYAESRMPSLKHLSRLCVNRNVKDASFLPVLPAPAFVVSYLTEYPFKL